MSDQTDTLTSLLTPYGLSVDESRVYLDLLSHSISSALTISRRIKTGRTKVYRILDSLIEKELVSQELDDLGYKFAAAHPQKLKSVVDNWQRKITSLTTDLPSVISTLEEHTGHSVAGSKVRYYSGKEGIRRVNFQMLRAKGELLSFEIETANAIMDSKDAEELRRRLVEEKITNKMLTNATHIQPFTKVSELVRSYWQVRHIPKDQLPITAESFIYNDIVVLYHYTGSDAFALEIYNSQLANMQRGIFNYIWDRAKPMKVVSDSGESRL